MTEPEDELRSRLKPVLASRLPHPRPGFEDRVAAGVVAAARHEPRTGRPRHEWLLVAAAALIAAVTVGTLLAHSPALQARPRSQPASRPHGTAAPTSTPTPDPATQATFLTMDLTAPGGPDHRLDWAGNARGTFVLPSGYQDPVVSPDGSYVLAPATSGQGIAIVDQTGAIVAKDTAPFGHWASDSRHGCRLRTTGAGVPLALQVAELHPGGPVTHTEVPLNLPRLLPTNLLGCSVADDRAVLFALPSSGSPALYVVQLSTGRLLSQHDYSVPETPVHPIMSGDGRYLAENHGDPSQQSPSADIRDIATGAIVGHVAGLVAGLSWDGRLAIATAGLNRGPTTVSDWRTGQAVWTYPAVLGRGRPLPGGENMAFTTNGSVLVLVRRGDTFTAVAASGVIDNLDTVEGVG